MAEADTISHTSKRNAASGQTAQSPDAPTIPVQVDPKNPGLDHPEENALPTPYRWFNDDELKKHHEWLAPMARTLNTAMDAVVSIGALSDMIRSSSEAYDFCQPTLTGPQVNALNVAIALMAEHVNDHITDLSAWIGDKTKEGGAQ